MVWSDSSRSVGIQLVPDLATEIPTPTDGGLTYTFQLRPGIRYSNGEVVAPADFLGAFERGWALDPSNHKDLYGGLVGPRRAEATLARATSPKAS